MKILQGIDLVKITRIEQAIKRQGKRFLDKVFSRSEQDYCDSKRMKFEHYAARFAAKEAFVKALKIKPKNKLIPRDIEIEHESTGKPYIKLNPKIRKITALADGDRIELSLAHEREYAVAMIVIVKS